MVRRTTELTVTGKFSGKLKMCFLRVEAPFIQILHIVAHVLRMSRVVIIVDS